MKKRLEYFDAMKGFGILSVIYVHLFTMGMRDGEYTSSITPFIQLYFMPLFFFVSGYFSVKIGNIQKPAELKPIILKKASGFSPIWKSSAVKQKYAPAASF